MAQIIPGDILFIRSLFLLIREVFGLKGVHPVRGTPDASFRLL
jgi:hypothetical protein